MLPLNIFLIFSLFEERLASFSFCSSVVCKYWSKQTGCLHMSSPAQLDCVHHLLTLHNRGFRNTWRFQVTVTWQLFHRFYLLLETKHVRCLVSLNQLLLNRGSLRRYVIVAVRWAVNICCVTLKGFHVRTPNFFWRHCLKTWIKRQSRGTY
jgi:hypothetical protein